jgi:hypothetical protein
MSPAFETLSLNTISRGNFFGQPWPSFECPQAFLWSFNVKIHDIRAVNRISDRIHISACIPRKQASWIKGIGKMTKIKSAPREEHAPHNGY